jgi:hypothetical protein
MNNKAAKKIRSIINPEDAITRKVYRRAKKQYKKTPKPLRAEFLSALEKMLGGNKENRD